MKLKRIMALVLCFAMVLSTMCFPTFAEGVTLDTNGYTAENVTVAGTVTTTPEGTITTAYISASYINGVPAVFSDATGVVGTESFIVELYSGENLVGTTTLVDTDKVLLNGESKTITWHAPLTDDGDEWWSTTWENGALNINAIPDTAKLYVDGTMVSECAVELNINDLKNPIFAAVTDDDGDILSFVAGTGYLNGTGANAPVYDEALQTAVNNATEGATIAMLRAGTYKVPTSKSVTITGAVDGVVFDNIGACNMGGASVTFNNVTFDYLPNTTYTGLQHAGDMVYNNCTFNGTVFLYGTSETFNNCTFNVEGDAYNVWTYGAKKVEFNGCTFNSTGKSLLIYAEGASIFNDVSVNDCDFVATSSFDGKAAIEMDSSLTSGINLTIDNATTATGFDDGSVSGNSLWNNKKGNADAANNDITVTVNNEVVLKPVVQGLSGTGTEDDPYLINNLEELIWFRDKVDEQASDGSTQFAGKYFKLTADIDLAGINWNPIGSMTGDHGSFKGVFDGNGKTISNLTISDFTENGAGLFARTSDKAEIKNLTLNNVTISSNTNYVGGVVANSFASTKITNVHVTGDVNISGRGYVGGISGHGYVVMDNVSVKANEGSIVTSSFWCCGGILGYGGEGATDIKNAHVENLTVTSAAGGLGAIVGMAEDNNGTQPISGSNLSAKNVDIKTYVGAYGTSYEDYAMGYLYGGNPTSELTGNLTVENVTVVTASGNPASVNDAVAQIGDNIYFNLAEALVAAKDGETVELIANENKVVDMNGAVYGKTVTITGTATVDWSKGNLFVGRGGEGNGTVIFDGANLTSASNSASYGIHVSGREKETTDKYDGTLKIKNSIIELDYLINKGTMTLDNSTLTVKNGFSVGGRPASETESGEDATATLTLNNNSKVIVNNHNGMGLGYEAIGVMNIDTTSAFETTQSFLVTAKGTMNIEGTAKIAGTLTNEGTINLADANATLTSSECGNVTAWDNGYNVVYADGAYALIKKDPSGEIAYRAYINDSEDREAVQVDLLNVYAEESVVIKLLDASGNVLTETTAKAGSVEAAAYTANIVLSGRTSGSWDTVIKAEKLTVANVPATIELWCDGKKVDTYENALGAGTNVDETSEYIALDCVYKAIAVYDSEGKLIDYCATLAEAVAAAQDGSTIKVLDNIEDGIGVKVESGKNFTLDLGGYTYTIASNPVGSTGTETNGFQLLKNSNIIIKNGTITSKAGSGVKVLVMNYANLTLDGVTLDGTNLDEVETAGGYVMSNNNGTTVIKDSTITAPDNGVAFDVDYQTSYPDGAKVSLVGTTTIDGAIVYEENEQNSLSKDTTVTAPAPDGYTWIIAGNKHILQKTGTGAGTVTTKKYTLTFDTNEGSKVDSLKAKKGTKISLDKYVSEKTGYKFDGWYSDKELTKKVTEITLNKDMTVYAKWVVSEDEPIVVKPDYKPGILTDEHYAYIVGREGGMIAPESDITRAEVATIIYRLLDEDERNKAKTKENVFTDVNEGDWFNTAVSTLASLELVKGRTTETFEPNAFITRAELATIFARMVEVEYDGKVLFSDVSGHWAESYINEAATAEWIVGHNGLFRPDDNITRAEVMTLVNRVLNREPESIDDLLDGMTTWKDNADENVWYYLAVQEATNSHTYEMKADGKHEKWIALTKNPDWAEIED